jgi:hypothetical protein
MLYDSKPVRYFTLVQLYTRTSGNTTNYKFPDQPELRGKSIEKIVTYNELQVPRTPDNNVVINLADISGAYLVLYVNEREDIKISLTHLVCSSVSSGATFTSNNGYLPLKDIKVEWSKSYVKVPSGIPIVNDSFIFGVFYK